MNRVLKGTRRDVMRRTLWFLVAGVFFVGALGCGSVEIVQKGDEGTSDTTNTDAGTPDAGTPDTTETDAIASDSQAPDATPSDVSVACLDDSDCADETALTQGLDEGCYQLKCVSGECAVAMLNDTPCDDGDGCTLEDLCSEGVCAGTPLACDDGDPCNGVESCDGSACVPGPDKLDDGTPCDLGLDPTPTASFCYANSCTGLFRSEVNSDCTMGATSKGPAQGIFISGAGATPSNQFFNFNYCENFDTFCSPKSNVCRISETGKVFNTGGSVDTSNYTQDMDATWMVGDFGTVGTVSGGTTDWNPPLRGVILQDDDPADVMMSGVSVIPNTNAPGDVVAVVGSRMVNGVDAYLSWLCYTPQQGCNSMNVSGISFTSYMRAVQLTRCNSNVEECDPAWNGLKAMWIIYEESTSDGSTLGVAYGDYNSPSGLLIPQSIYSLSDTYGYDFNTVMVGDEFWAVDGGGLFLRCAQNLGGNGQMGCMSLDPWPNQTTLSYKGIWASPQSVFLLMESYIDGAYVQTLAVLPEGKSPSDSASYHMHILDENPDPTLIMSGMHQLMGSPSMGPIVVGSTNTSDGEKVRVEHPMVLQP